MQLFVPCILMGCSFGRFYGELMKWYIFPGAGIAPGTYALMGAVGMLGGVARMTISLTVILMETTQNLQFLLPIMMILLVGKWVGDTFNISLYDLHVEIQCMPFVEAWKMQSSWSTPTSVRASPTCMINAWSGRYPWSPVLSSVVV